MSRRIGFRHCDARFGFLWLSSTQPAARWHGEGEGPANYFADTPVGAWAEFLRHEGITDPADLAGLKRSMWAVELPDGDLLKPDLPEVDLVGGLASYEVCQDEARRLRAGGAAALEAPSAALMPGGARGWVSTVTGFAPSAVERDGKVWVHYGAIDTVAWLAVDAGAPPASVLQWVRPLTD